MRPASVIVHKYYYWQVALLQRLFPLIPALLFTTFFDHFHQLFLASLPIFTNITSGYSFFKDHCSKNNIEFDDFPDIKLISTREIENLRVVNSLGLEIKGIASSVSGMDSEGYEITIEGVNE